MVYCSLLHVSAFFGNYQGASINFKAKCLKKHYSTYQPTTYAYTNVNVKI